MIYCLNDHKTGFDISRKIIKSIPLEIEVRTFIRFWHDYSSKDKYLVFIRHPYEIITSGYNYHKKCEETWVLRDENMLWWWIENHFTPESIEQNKDILERYYFSKYKPYQEILNTLPLIEGIKYEMQTVGKMTIMSLYEYPHYNKPNVMTIKMEDLQQNFYKTCENILHFLDIESKDLLNDLLKYDLKNMDHDQIKNDNHITNKKLVTCKYKELWTEELYDLAKEIFPYDLLDKLGYSI